MTTENAKQTSEIHTNKNEGFISEKYKNLDLEVQTIQKKKKRKQKKTNKSKTDISENISNEQSSNDDEFAHAGIDSIIDHQCGIKVIPIENDMDLLSLLL